MHQCCLLQGSVQLGFWTAEATPHTCVKYVVISMAFSSVLFGYFEVSLLISLHFRAGISVFTILWGQVWTAVAAVSVSRADLTEVMQNSPARTAVPQDLAQISLQSNDI